MIAPATPDIVRKFIAAGKLSMPLFPVDLEKLERKINHERQRRKYAAMGLNSHGKPIKMLEEISDEMKGNKQL